MRGYAAIGLVNTKISSNVGGAMRACACYGASLIVVSGRRYTHECTDVNKAYRHIPLIQTNDMTSVIPKDCVPVAVEITDDAIDLCEYKHPERAFYIFGQEDGSIKPSVLSACRDVVKINTRFCMNLASTVNVVLYDRLMKRGER